MFEGSRNVSYWKLIREDRKRNKISTSNQLKSKASAIDLKALNY